MFKVAVNKTYTNESFLAHELSDDEYELQLFIYRIRTVTHLGFVPPIGLEVRLRGTDFRVDALMYDGAENCFYVYETVDVSNIDVARKIVSKYLKDGWELTPN